MSDGLGAIVWITENLHAADASAAWLVGIASTGAWVVDTHGSDACSDSGFDFSDGLAQRFNS